MDRDLVGILRRQRFDGLDDVVDERRDGIVTLLGLSARICGRKCPS
jgi:hypothetical protein